MARPSLRIYIMNILGIVPNSGELSNVKPGSKQNSGLLDYKGPSFAENMHEVARSANIQVASGNMAASLAFTRQKEDFNEPFSFVEAEEDLYRECMEKIQELMDRLREEKDG